MEALFAEFSEFLQASPTPYHFCEFVRKYLTSHGFVEVSERESNPLPKDGFIIRSNRSLFAYRDRGHSRAVLCGSHCDSPCWILKPSFEDIDGTVRKMRVTNYGGGMWWSWMDRPLKLVGVVMCRTEKGLVQRLFDSKKAIGVMPNVCVHYTGRPLTANYDLENDFVPIYGTKDSIMDYIAKELGVNVDDIVSWNLRLMGVQKPTLFEDGLFAGQQLDNLTNTFAILKALVDGEVEEGCTGAVFVFDNEEIGSLTRCGANGTWMTECMKRIVGDDDYRVMKENSIVISADSTHGTHPNYSSETEVNHPSVLGKGFCIEVGTSGTARHFIPQEVVKSAARKIGANIQIVAEKNGPGGGSTIGPMSEAFNGIPTLDIGTPVLGMHSIREFSSIVDIATEIDVVKELFAHYSEHKVTIE